MKRIAVLITAVLALPIMPSWAANENVLDADDIVGVGVSVTDAVSADYTEHSNLSGGINLTFTGNNYSSHIGADAYSNEEYLDGMVKYETAGSVYLAGDDRISRFVEKSGYGINGGCTWLLDDNHVIGLDIDFSSTVKNNIEDLYGSSVHRIDGTANSNVLLGSIAGSTCHETDEIPFGLNAELAYCGHIGQVELKFNTGFHMSRDGRNSVARETDLENFSYGILSSGIDKNRLAAFSLGLNYKGLDLGGEATYAYHYSDYFLGGRVPDTQAFQNDVFENTGSLSAGYTHNFANGMVSASLRYEHVDFSYANVLDRSDEFDRRDDCLNPALFFSSAVGPALLSIRYDMSDIRPDFNLCNDAIRYGSRFLFQSGNTGLKEQKQQHLSLELKHESFSFECSYNRLDNPVIQMFAPIEKTSHFYTEGAIIGRPVNADSPLRSLSASVNCLFSLGAFGTFTLNGGLDNQWFELETGSATVSFSNRPVWRAGASLQSSLWDGACLTAGFTFRSKGYIRNVYNENAIYDLNASLQQKILRDESLTLKIEGTDLLRHTYSNIRFDCGDMTVFKSLMPDTRRIQASLCYVFNAVQKHKSGYLTDNEVFRRMKQLQNLPI